VKVFFSLSIAINGLAGENYRSGHENHAHKMPESPLKA
jgi:hypothetical protein